MMDGGQSISRKRQSAHDLLSDLPLGIIHCILALVPITDAVRTCLLSRQWRYTWASLPHLVFDDRCQKSFITTALFLHKGPIHKFGLFVTNWPIFPDLDHWLLYLSRNEIRELCLDLDHYSIRMNSALYSCQKLTHLELLHCVLSPPPLTFKGFSFLRSLVLQGVELPFDVETLVADSPLLESFTCRGTWHVGQASSKLRISAPKLKCFCFRGGFQEISLNAPLVDQVSVSLSVILSRDEDEDRGEQLQPESSVCNFTKFLGGITNLERFSAKSFFTMYLSFGIESYGRSLVFHRLKFIQLNQVRFHFMKETSVLVHLIMGAPNLHELKISTCIYSRTDASKAPPISFSGFDFSPNFTFKKLKVVKMKHVLGFHEMRFIEYLLKSSPVLETMNLYCRPKVILNLATEVLRYSRASPDAKIFLTQIGESF